MTTPEGDPVIVGTGIARAREDLFAAHLLATTGFTAQAVALAFRSALGAASAALLLLDRAPGPEPATVVAVFVRHVVRERGLDHDIGRRLRLLLNCAVQADTDGAVPPAEGSVAIDDATAVVDAVAAWIDNAHRVASMRTGGGPSKARGTRPPR